MMVQAWRKVDFGTGTVTFLDDTQKEDILQVEYPNGFLLDMGWYQDRYIILAIRDFDWVHPVKQYETEDWVTGVSYLSTWRAAESGAVTVTMPI